jgi:hypothetical protein
MERIGVPSVARVGSSLLLLLGVALGLRVAAWLIMPAVPTLVVLLMLLAIYRYVFLGRR